MNLVYISIAIFTVLILIGYYVIYIHPEKFDPVLKHEKRYKLIIPKNGMLLSKYENEYGSNSMPEYSLEQAIEIYNRGVEMVKEFENTDYKTWEDKKLNNRFTDIITAIGLEPSKVDEITKDMDDFNNNRVIAAANIYSIESMIPPAMWITDYNYTSAKSAYEATHDLLLST